jgi:hypothetical protein
MPDQSTRVERVAVPVLSAVATAFQSTHLADAFAIALPPDASVEPEVLARFVFAVQPAWIGALIRVRDAIVGRFGLKTARHLATLPRNATVRRIDIFRVFGTSETEVVLGENDRHLDFRVSILCTRATSPATASRLTLTTVVHCHNRLGRAYLAVIAPFHRRVVKASLRRAARMGWPKACVDTCRGSAPEA